MAGVWLISSLFTAPLRDHEGQLRSRIAELQGRISTARLEQKDIQDLETKAANVRSELQHLDGESSGNPPIVWIPELLQQHFRQFGFAELTTKVQSTEDEPEFPGYQRISWRMGLPMHNIRKEIGDLLSAVAALEQAEQIVRVDDVKIPREADKLGRNFATVSFSTLVRK